MSTNWCYQIKLDKPVNLISCRKDPRWSENVQRIQRVLELSENLCKGCLFRLRNKLLHFLAGNKLFLLYFFFTLFCFLNTSPQKLIRKTHIYVNNIYCKVSMKIVWYSMQRANKEKSTTIVQICVSSVQT